MSEKCGTLKALDLRKRNRFMTERFGKKKKKKLREKRKKMLLISNFPFFFFSIFSILLKRTIRVFDYISIYLSFANTSNLDLPNILSFGKG